jgi:hypothetical protein
MHRCGQPEPASGQRGENGVESSSKLVARNRKRLQPRLQALLLDLASLSLPILSQPLSGPRVFRNYHRFAVLDSTGTAAVVPLVVQREPFVSSIKSFSRSRSDLVNFVLRRALSLVTVPSSSARSRDQHGAPLQCVPCACRPIPRRDDAALQTNPRPRPPRPHQRRTPNAHRTRRRRRTPTPSLVRRQLRTTTLLRESHWRSLVCPHNERL